MRAFTKEWLKAANDEIINNDFLTHITAFHAQKSIEKVMKAILEEYQIDFPKIHKLVKLKTLFSIELTDIDEEIMSALDELYIESRF